MPSRSTSVPAKDASSWAASRASIGAGAPSVAPTGAVAGSAGRMR
ncbi:hypothetical protein [Brachybacterium sp. GPGPB12]